MLVHSGTDATATLTHRKPDRSRADGPDRIGDQPFDLGWRPWGDHGLPARVPLFFPEGFFGHYLTMLGTIGGPSCKAKATQFGQYEAVAGTGQAHIWLICEDDQPLAVLGREVGDRSLSV